MATKLLNDLQNLTNQLVRVRRSLRTNCAKQRFEDNNPNGDTTTRTNNIQQAETAIVRLERSIAALHNKITTASQRGLEKATQASDSFESKLAALGRVPTGLQKLVTFLGRFSVKYLAPALDKCSVGANGNANVNTDSLLESIRKTTSLCNVIEKLTTLVDRI